MQGVGSAGTGFGRTLVICLAGNQNPVCGVFMGMRTLLKLQLLAFIFVTTLPAQTAPSQDALQLLRRMQEALGGADKLAAIRDYDWKITAKIYGPGGQYGGEGVRRIRLVLPNHFRCDQTIPMGEVIWYFDGTKGWEITPDNGYATLAGGELEFVMREAGGFYLKLWLADHNPDFTITSGGPNVIRIAYKGAPTDITVDPQTGLPTRTASKSLSNPDAPVPAYTEVKEWQTVNGVKLPQRILNYHSGTLVADIRTTEIRINSGLDARDLAAPPKK